MKRWLDVFAAEDGRTMESVFEEMVDDFCLKRSLQRMVVAHGSVRLGLALLLSDAGYGVPSADLAAPPAAEGLVASKDPARDESPVPKDPNHMLRRAECAAALSRVGFPVATKTLATRATRGGGPPMQRWGKIPLYRWGDALEWASARLGPSVRSTSELDVLVKPKKGTQ
jgi:hypothetical protein